MAELAISLSLVVFKHVIGLGYEKGRLWAAKHFENGDVENKFIRDLILTELDKVKSMLQKQAHGDLLASIKHFKTGLEYLNDVLSKDNSTAEEKRGSLQTSEFFADPDLATATENIKLLKLSELDESAKQKLKEAKKRFEDSRKKATDAFSNKGLKMFDRVLAANIGVMAVILENIKDPSIALPECRNWLNDLHEMEGVKKTFQRAVTGKSNKSPFSGDQAKCFLGVYHINSVIYDVTQTMTRKVEKSWIWPCIDVGGEKVDPLRDARVAEILRKPNMSQNCITLSFGQAQEPTLKSARNVAMNKQGHFIIADQGDSNIKEFDGNGMFLRSFHPLCRRLADEDVLSVTSDNEDNLFILIKIDKYRYEVYVFDALRNLTNKFRLKEGIVRCSPIVNDNNEIIVVREGVVLKTSVVEVYKDWQHVDNFELKEPNELTKPKEPKEPTESKLPTVDLKEPKQSKEPIDIALTDHGNLIVLNSDGSVDELTTQGKRQMFEGVPTEGLEAIAFHSLSKHLVITNMSDGIVKISIYTKDGKCVDIIHQGEDRRGREEKKCIAPKIAVTNEGRIALLTGLEGESKVIVL
ncbi:hypothetical protein ACROYT_G025241 [Oculina patagonica]